MAEFRQEFTGYNKVLLLRVSKFNFTLFLPLISHIFQRIYQLSVCYDRRVTSQESATSIGFVT
jgi:hypothetical protein